MGLLAAARGAQVRLSDRCPAVLAALRRSVEENGLESHATVEDLAWDRVPQGVKVDLVLASEVIYQEETVEPRL